MKLRSIDLYTADLLGTRAFYTEVLGFSVVDETSQHLTVQIGWTNLTFNAVSFKPTPTFLTLHLPARLLDVCQDYYQLHNLDACAYPLWKSEVRNRCINAGYCRDTNGNLLFLLGRSDIPACHLGATASQLYLGVFEIGIASEHVAETVRLLNSRLSEELTWIYKGTQRLAYVGNHQGRFVILEQGKPWPLTHVIAQFNYCSLLIESHTDRSLQRVFSYEINRLPIGFREGL